MDKLKDLIKQRKQATKGTRYIIRGDEEEKKRQEYQKKQELHKEEEEAKLGKRLIDMEKYYDYAKLNVKKIKPIVREKILTVEEQKVADNIKVNDTEKREISEIDFEITPEDRALFKLNNEAFQKKREETPDDDHLTPPDFSEEVEYNEQCEDIFIWLKKIFEEWELEIKKKENLSDVNDLEVKRS